MLIYRYRKGIVLATLVLCVVAGYFASQVTFVFDFERFFPKGDDDLAFFNEFRENFEDDDNYLLVAFSDPTSIFNENVLKRVDSFTEQSRKLPHVSSVQSITNFKYFRKFPLGGLSPPYPAIHPDRPERFSRDSSKLMQDERIYGNLISKNARATVVILKTKNALDVEEADELMDGVNKLLKNTPTDRYHMIGRAYFQKELVRQQIKEFVISTAISALLVAFVFWVILRRRIGVAIAIVSMAICLLVFLGLIGLFGIELDVLSTLFPIIMIIVGVSDVVHLTNKYIDEYDRTGDKEASIKKAIREIGLATFLTSFTTAIGFLSLVTSRILPVRNFGFTAAIGVVSAYAVVITFTAALLAIFPADKIIKQRPANLKWRKYLSTLYHKTKGQSRPIFMGAIVYLIVCLIGLSKISTDIKIYDTLPRGIKLTEDFHFFEKQFAGFRPFEVAVTVQPPHRADDYDVLRQIDKMEKYLKANPYIEGVASVTALYKSMNRALGGDQVEAYTFPDTEAAFDEMAKYVRRIPSNEVNIMVTPDRSKARITSKVKDIGSDKINVFIEEANAFSQTQLDTSLVKMRVTGTGVIFDKNNKYLRRNLLYGLGLAFLIISLIMALLFKNLKMIVISLIPNVFPLLCGAALMGYFGIALDAPTAIIFAISFGIAVDDTIHFLSKYKIERLNGNSIEDSIHSTFVETGKAIIITSIILFFGFLILLFSKTVSVVFVGTLVSATLLSAVLSDLLLIPPLIRFFIKE